jgi:hypothetical protein
MAGVPDQPEMMRTGRGVRIIARPATENDAEDVYLIVAGIAIGLELEESHRLRDLLQAAELTVKRRRTADHETQ